MGSKNKEERFWSLHSTVTDFGDKISGKHSVIPCRIYQFLMSRIFSLHLVVAADGAHARFGVTDCGKCRESFRTVVFGTGI